MDKEVKVFFIIIGTIFLIVGCFLAFDRKMQKKNSITTTAIVTSIESKNKYRNRKIKEYAKSTNISYEVDGIKYSSSIGYVFFHKRGKEIEIYYDKYDPSKVSSNSSDIIIYMVPGMGLTLILVAIFSKSKKNKK